MWNALRNPVGGNMKLIDAVGQNRHNIFRGDGSGRASTLRGEKFYTWFDKTFGIPALEVQPPKITNNMVLRNATNPKKRKAQTSGVFHFSPEKTRGAVERPSFLIGQGGFNPFSSLTPLPTLTSTDDKARTDHSGQPSNHDSKEYDGREQSGRPDLNLLCPPSRESSPT